MKDNTLFRSWGKYASMSVENDNEMYYFDAQKDNTGIRPIREGVWMRYTGLDDKDGNKIFFGDILQFDDKWEWYRGTYGIPMYFADKKEHAELKKKYENEPMERRVIDSIEDYDWLLSSDREVYWKVIGNIYETPELIPKDK